MGQGRAQVYNLVSIVFVVLSLLAAVFVTLRMIAPPPVVAPVVEIAPTVAVLPSPTATFTNTYTPIPTETETPTLTITPTISPTLTWTLIPTLTASLTFTVVPTGTQPPTDIPSLTFTPAPTTTEAPTSTEAPSATIEPSLTITNTLVITPTEVPSITPTTNSFTPQPTSPPPSPFPFVLRDGQVIYTTNFANTAGCAWQGIGGQAFDLNGQPLIGLRVHVFGAGGIDLYTSTGSNTLYGLSGWEVPLNTTVTSNSYLVELQSAQGTIISPQVTVTFTPDCSKNLALVGFEQTRPF